MKSGSWRQERKLSFIRLPDETTKTIMHPKTLCKQIYDTRTHILLLDRVITTHTGYAPENKTYAAHKTYWTSIIYASVICVARECFTSSEYCYLLLEGIRRITMSWIWNITILYDTSPAKFNLAINLLKKSWINVFWLTLGPILSPRNVFFPLFQNGFRSYNCAIL